MLSYVMAMRKALKHYRNLKEFKVKIKESAQLFEEMHDICGIRQCLELA